MKFMPRSRATRTERRASLRSTGRNSCPIEEAPKLSQENSRPVRPSGRYFMARLPHLADAEPATPPLVIATGREAAKGTGEKQWPPGVLDLPLTRFSARCVIVAPGRRQ